MAYSLTTASSLQDVISQMHSFAVANAGFADAGDISLSGGRTLKRLSKGGIYYHLAPHATLNKIRGYMGYSARSTDVPASTTSDSQPYDTIMSAWAFPGPYPSLYLYSEGTCVYAVVELTNGIFNHFAFGKITKTDTFTGGEFMTAGHYDTQFTQASIQYYYPVDSGNQHAAYQGSNISAGQSSGAGFVRAAPAAGAFNDYRDFAGLGFLLNNQRAGMSGPNSITDRLLRDSPNAATLRTPIFPMYVMILDPSPNLYRLAGYLPGVRACPNRYVDPAELILTDWQVFPLTQKNATGLICAPCGNYGVAYKRA
jgi:hypothetical protein